MEFLHLRSHDADSRIFPDHQKDHLMRMVLSAYCTPDFKTQLWNVPHAYVRIDPGIDMGEIMGNRHSAGNDPVRSHHICDLCSSSKTSCLSSEKQIHTRINSFANLIICRTFAVLSEREVLEIPLRAC